MKNVSDLKVLKDYDAPNDSLFMFIGGDIEYKESIEINDHIILDFDKKGEIVSFEILDVSKILGVDKFSIKNLKKLRGNIGVNKDFILVDFTFTVPVHQKNIEKPILIEAPNDLNLPNTTASLGLATA
ncbi:DUF2283 domain-containing protein [Methanobacterium petrolearium]|uniref:DUF2283 domain-containing protein n=1 Tax=Methanobacterium petrolearium TaxID=710190 RepID=UPI001AE6CE76|nr:DUF2283 domain-containing protein [Methanobacterium petrolearium]MBP1945389.1 uncharacterized protein YuzE [Methanobacterium petrolearium]BDZ71582.1 hypothetical protein GCM10025861_20990 [Methanobacterium petrolearium]